MAKGTFLNDTFEQLAEFGQSTAKASAKAVVKTFNPLSALEKKNNQGKDQIEEMRKEGQKSGSHTPLDMEKLSKKYEDQDKVKTEALRNRLFNLVKSGDEKVLMEKKREEEEKKRREEWEEEEKKRRQKQHDLQQQNAAIPQGKQRKSIFSAKKVAKREQTEVKPSSGKQ